MEPSMSLWSSVVLLGALALWNTGTLFVFAQPGAADALQAFKHALGDPPQLRSWMGDDPCSASSSWRGIKCGGDSRAVVSLTLSALGLHGLLSSELEKLSSLVILWLDGNHLYGTIPSGLGKLKNLTSLRLSGNHLSGQVPAAFATLPNLKELFLDGNSLNISWSSKLSTNVRLSENLDSCPACSPSLAPALVFGPGEGMPQNQDGGHKSHAGAIAGAVVGAVVLVAISIGLVSLCLMRVRHWPSATSDTASSDPSAQVDWAKGRAESSLTEGAIAAAVEAQHAKQFAFQELDHATKGFNPSNLIGRGRFGLVYKGLLEDGTIVAIKTRASAPTQEFVTEVVNLSQLRHKNVVSLLGFCQEHDHQMLVYDYLPNGSVSSHLCDPNGNPTGELDFKQRVAIALGAARGLEYLHSGNPPRVHQDFKTSNVLLDENLVAKVTDVGLSKLLVTSHNAMPSANGSSSHFADPAAVYNTYRVDPKSDVYSYGVFLLELISGRQAINRSRPAQPSPGIVEWARSLQESSSSMEGMVDKSLVGTEEAGTLLLLGLHCTAQSPEKRPTMSQVSQQVERILDKERGGIVAAGEGPTVVTLGSELFK
ncbi:probable serine/threonine-protein kinase PBL21 [Selaginella moellendorffii]|uniref:probable serine/threonine-protein kinase PBL21 n=1 Tax=Selaginella moellendorffii TaxID=88036 RepID=UPI000D1C738D|nr:probable serine/threonine-protein kinase PBL21 [Selaginella moellendorffii]|eukprot:XP_024521907.1 probable serine/threonine-protein kinase PBL21 [Selaginella moellendorffii]